MDAIVKNFPQTTPESNRPSQKEAEDAVRTLLRWAGDDPAREGLLDTPAQRSSVRTASSASFWLGRLDSGVVCGKFFTMASICNCLLIRNADRISD